MSARDRLLYQTGFGNEFATEALPGALPRGQNSPQDVPYGLYAEQISGTAFTVPRSQNRRSWLYRIRPSVVHKPFVRLASSRWESAPFNEVEVSPNQMRWDPLPIPDEPRDFIDGITTIAGNGDTAGNEGMAVHIYTATASMSGRYFYNADGEILIVPEQGDLNISTEFGILEVSPGEIALVPRLWTVLQTP